MVKKKDLCKVFFIYLCMVHVCPAHPCGENPLRGFMSLARMTGKEVVHLLDILRSANYDLYSRLESEWQIYANCVGMVDTGYFKRSGYAATKLKSPFNQPVLQQFRLRDLIVPSSRREDELF